MSKKIVQADILSQFFSQLTEADIKAIDLKIKIAGCIQQKRKELKLTQKEFAKRLGVTQAMVSKWESGEQNFTIENLADISYKLGINFDIIFDTRIEQYKQLDKKLNMPNTLFRGYDVAWEKINVRPTNTFVRKIKEAV